MFRANLEAPICRSRELRSSKLFIPLLRVGPDNDLSPSLETFSHPPIFRNWFLIRFFTLTATKSHGATPSALNGSLRSRLNRPSCPSHAYPSDATDTTSSNAQGDAESQYQSTAARPVSRRPLLGPGQVAKPSFECGPRSIRDTDSSSCKSAATRDSWPRYICLSPY